MCPMFCSVCGAELGSDSRRLPMRSSQGFGRSCACFEGAGTSLANRRIASVQLTVAFTKGQYRH